MNIISYNINGLRSFFNNGKLEDLLNNHPADLYCFQEVRADKEKIDGILSKYANYSYVTSINNYKKGYAGVAFLINKSILDKIKSISEKQFAYNNDPTYTNGRIIVAEFDKFYIVNVYVVNSGNKEQIRIDFDNQLRAFLKGLDKPYIVCGDFNVCATKYDYYGNYEKAINSGAALMQFEIDGYNKLINECKLVDSYRMLNGNNRQYSWFSPRSSRIDESIGWRLDYFLLSDDIKCLIGKSMIWSGYQGADHSPIELEINF